MGYSPLQTLRVSRPGDAYLNRALDAFRAGGSPSRRFLVGVICATTGLGLLGEGVAMAVAPRHPVIGQALFFFAIFVSFAIFLTVLMIPRLGILREITVAILGLFPTMVYRMSSPLVLSSYDEHLHAQTLINLLLGSGLFAPNPGLPVSPYFPGLEVFTGVVIRLSGLPVVLAITLVILLCRLLLVLIIYQAALTVTTSRRGASLVVAIYAVSSHFYSFDSGFAYETLALTLGLGGIFLLRRAQLADYTPTHQPLDPRLRPPRWTLERRRLFVAASLVLVATVVTHHATSYMVLAFLIAWAALSPKGERKVPAAGAVVMGVAVAIWSAALAPRLIGYFVPIFSTAIQSARSFLAGTGHHIFGSSGGTPPPPDWERAILVLYTLTTTLAALACAWIMLSRAFRNRDGLLGLLGVLNLAFPITAATHFDPEVGELGARAATFLFLPLALSCSLIILRHPRVTGRPAEARNPLRPAVLIAVIGVTAFTYLGGVLLGSNPDYSRLPGPYLPSADFRSQDAETLAAVAWAAMHLPTGSVVAADRDPAVLLLQARMWPVSGPQKGFAPAQLYFSRTWGHEDTAIVKGLHIHYLYVDTRLSESLPYLGYYFSQGETSKPTRLTVAELTKFAHVPGLKAVYHHGPVTIYDTSGLGVVIRRAGFTKSNQTMGLGLFDAFLGAAIVLLIWLSRRRLTWIKSAAQDIGVLGTTLAVIAIAIFIGGALFDFRLMPGPAFTLGVLAASVVILAVRRRNDDLPVVPRLRFPSGSDPRVLLQPLVLLGVVAGAAGLAIAIYAAWITDVVDVHAILRAVGS